ncbi:MAG: hypothetical protein V4563_02640 [Pseudomonadota bacterium]
MNYRTVHKRVTDAETYTCQRQAVIQASAESRIQSGIQRVKILLVYAFQSELILALHVVVIVCKSGFRSIRHDPGKYTLPINSFLDNILETHETGQINSAVHKLTKSIILLPLQHDRPSNEEYVQGT